MDRLAVIRQLRTAGVECYTRDEWGSPREADDSYTKRAHTHPMPAGPAKYHFLHLSVTSDTDTVREGAAGARQIETYGYSTPPMVSYQDLVTNEGRYFQGQDYGTKGTHTVNDRGVPGFPRDLNLEGYALALMQNVDDPVTDEQVQVAAMVFAARELAGFVVRGAPIFPHRKFAKKACPGDRAMARLDEMQRLKDHYVTHGLPNQEDDMPTAEEFWSHKDPKTGLTMLQLQRRAAKSLDATRNHNKRNRELLREILATKTGTSIPDDLAGEILDELAARLTEES